MNKECIGLIKAIGCYDFIIGTVVSIILIPFFGGGAGLFFIGIACSFFNFIINSYANSRLIRIKNVIQAILFASSYIVRIGVVCITAIFLMIRSDVSFFIFISGYTAQLLSIVMYGVELKVKEGV